MSVAAILLLVNVGNVYAQTISAVPGTATAGTSFQVNGSGLALSTSFDVYVFASGTCPPGLGGAVSHQTTSTDPTGSFSLTFSTTGLGVGTYCIFATDLATVPFPDTQNVTTSVIVAPASTSPAQYQPVMVGGRMLPINRLQVILPWLLLIAVLSMVSVWTLIVKRRRQLR